MILNQPPASDDDQLRARKLYSNTTGRLLPILSLPGPANAATAAFIQRDHHHIIHLAAVAATTAAVHSKRPSILLV